MVQIWLFAFFFLWNMAALGHFSISFHFTLTSSTQALVACTSAVALVFIDEPSK
jgi:hypothetical protein